MSQDSNFQTGKQDGEPTQSLYQQQQPAVEPLIINESVSKQRPQRLHTKSIPKPLKRLKKRRAGKLHKHSLMSNSDAKHLPPSLQSNHVPERTPFTFSNLLSSILLFYTTIILPTVIKYHKQFLDFTHHRLITPISNAITTPQITFSTVESYGLHLKTYTKSQYNALHIKLVHFKNTTLTADNLQSQSKIAYAFILAKLKDALTTLLDCFTLDNDTMLFIGLILGIISIMAIVVVGMQMELEKNQFR